MKLFKGNIMSKIKRCTEPSCRTLTSNKLCAAHTMPEQSIETQTQAAADVRLEQLEEADRKSSEWEARADRMDSLRAELAELHGSARSNIHEQPIFTKQYEGEFHG
jgi:hypothetical protein